MKLTMKLSESERRELKDALVRLYGASESVGDSDTVAAFGGLTLGTLGEAIRGDELASPVAMKILKGLSRERITRYIEGDN